MRLEECQPTNNGRCRLDDLFASEEIHPGDLKNAVEELLETHIKSRLIEHLPDAKELSKLIDEAFPLPAKKGKNQANKSPQNKDAPKKGAYYWY